MIQLTERQKQIRNEKFNIIQHIAELRDRKTAISRQLSYLTRDEEMTLEESSREIERLHKEFCTQPDISMCVQILVYFRNGELLEKYTYWSTDDDYIADALIRFSEHQPYARKLVADGKCQVYARLIEIQEHDPNR